MTKKSSQGKSNPPNIELQVFYWIEDRLSRTQRRGTGTRKRLNRFESITFSGKPDPQYLAHFFNEITILLFEYEYRFTE